MAFPSVLIAGADPTGLVLAIILLQNNVSVRIIDKEPEHRIGSRGAGIQPRTLELYDILGIGDVQRDGDRLPQMAQYEQGKIEPTALSNVVEWKEPTPDLPHPNGVVISQERHEEILREHLQKLSCTVELGSELLSFEQFPDRIEARLRVKTGADGTQQREEIATFDWLVGADGARSVVRKQLGLSFLGETVAEQSMAVGDIVVEEGLRRGCWHTWTMPPNFISLRSNNTTSDIFTFSYTGRPAHLADKTMRREEFIEDFYAITGRRDVKFGEAKWLSNYRPNMRMVDTMRVGRVFLAGDAAHCHTPAGGQGLNSSVQDAANIAWKLALVHKGLAAPPLLDTYTEERLRVIKHMLLLTTGLYNKSYAHLKQGGKPDDNRWKRGGEMGMLGVNYQGSSIVLEDRDPEGTEVAVDDAYKAAGGRVQAAYRAPDASGLVRIEAATGSELQAPLRLFTGVFRATVHTVLLFGRVAAELLPRISFGGSVQTILLLPSGETATTTMPQFGDVDMVLEDRAGHAYTGYGVSEKGGEPTIVVVRPDGMVGAVIKNAEGLETYFKKIFI